MIEYVVRGILLIHGLLLALQGMSYTKTPQNEVFITLLKKEGLQGPGLNIAVPFLGISYVTVGVSNFLACVTFGFNEACYILIASGTFFHIGMSIVRSRLDMQTSNLYKPGMIYSTNLTQICIGLVCCTVGILGIIYR